MNAWAALVSAIERGYSDDIYEYTNDLYCRNWLHEAWILLDEHIVQLWTPRIKALDDRYRAATVEEVMEVPGIGRRTAEAVLAAVGTTTGVDAVPAFDPATGEVV